jgi:hypothetical protein
VRVVSRIQPRNPADPNGSQVGLPLIGRTSAALEGKRTRRSGRKHRARRRATGASRAADSHVPRGEG